jgi:hypothetical protein
MLSGCMEAPSERVEGARSNRARDHRIKRSPIEEIDELTEIFKALAAELDRRIPRLSFGGGARQLAFYPDDDK